MIKRLRFSEKNAKEWYNEIYKHGGYKPVDKNYQSKMLEQLGVPFNKKKKLLDVACGNGFLLQEAEKRVSAFGVDLSETALKNAKKNTASPLACSSGQALPFRSGTFDFLTCLGSLEHFIDIDAALEEFSRVMADGALANIHVPNSKYLVHKVLKVDTQGQPNERLATEKEWKKVIESHMPIEKVNKYNTRPYLEWIPKRYCCHFTFICRKN